MQEILAALGMGVLAGGAIVYLIQERRRRVGVRRLLSTRQPLDDETFGRKFFPHHAATAATVRRVLAQRGQRNLDRALPEDRLVEDLQLTSRESPFGVEELMMHVENELDVRLPDDAHEQCKTLGDVTRCAVDAMQRKHQKDAMT